MTLLYENGVVYSHLPDRGATEHRYQCLAFRDGKQIYSGIKSVWCGTNGFQRLLNYWNRPNASHIIEWVYSPV